MVISENSMNELLVMMMMMMVMMVMLILFPLWKKKVAKSAQRKGSNQAAKPLEEDANKKNLHLCPLNGPRHDMNLCKVMQEQSKAMKLTWSTDCGSGACYVRFQGAKKRPAKGQELNALLVNVVKEVLK